MDGGGLTHGGKPLMRTSTRSWHGLCVDRFPAQRRTLCHLMELQASANPDRAWLVSDGASTLTFGEAAERALAEARRIGSVGSRPQIGIAMRGGLDLVVLLHATLLAGGTAYLLDPAWPAPTATDALRGLRLDVLFVDTSVPTRTAGPVEWRVAERIVDVAPNGGDPPADQTAPPADQTQTAVPWAEWSSEPGSGRTALPRDGDGDAIVMFTSGTTGVPKGVVCSHHYAYCYSALVTDSLERGPDDVLTSPLPLFHSGGLHMAVHSALQAGCTAHVKSRFSASGFWRAAAADGATQANLVAEMARMIERVAEPETGHRLRYLIAGGFHDHRAFEERFSTTVLSQAYGTSEVYVSPMRKERWDDDPDAGSDILGLPLDCFAYGAVDDDGRLLPAGATGELVVRPSVSGVTFTRYLREPGATATAWRGGFLHTGDLVAIDASGLLRFRGRVAGRIRRRGETVSAAEVERAAVSLPGVTCAAAYAIPGDFGDDEIKLDVTGTAAVDLAALARGLDALLRPAARPRYIEQLESLALTSTMRPMYQQLRARGVQWGRVFDTRRMSNGQPTEECDKEEPT